MPSGGACPLDGTSQEGAGVSEYRVLFFDNANAPHVCRAKFPTLPQAINHACGMAWTWKEAQVVEVAARVYSNAIKKGRTA